MVLFHVKKSWNKIAKSLGRTLRITWSPVRGASGDRGVIGLCIAGARFDYWELSSRTGLSCATVVPLQGESIAVGKAFMRLPIDTQSVRFAVAGPAEPILDFESKSQKYDETGAPLFGIPLFAVGTGVRDSIVVKVPGETKGLVEFSPVRVVGLVATTWEVGSNHGVSFRAEKVEIVRATA
jgi:hypothetical protein